MILFAACVPAYASLSFNVTFGSSITTDSHAAAIESDIDSVLAMYSADISTDITVAIDFEEMTSGLGQSSTAFGNVSYATFCGDLHATSSGASDAIAYGGGGSLASCGANNPITNDSTINVSTANARAVGIFLTPPVGQPDGTISINTQITDGGTGPCASGCFSFDAVVEHEVDEVLGLGSSLQNATSGTVADTMGDPFPQDLFRYSSAGTRSFAVGVACTSLGSAYFSIDGGNTNLAGFNNACNGGDFADWDTATSRVQNWAATAGANPPLGVELTALDVIGYTLAPEPSTFFLFGLSVGALAVFRRRTRV